ncbi:MAG: flagellar basal body P-ring formation chaperone FlgA [Planctomycetota bacterium]|nr:flagellar basal body P-ring formation chaperone FlgA [Planctomycetota bacterium]
MTADASGVFASNRGVAGRGPAVGPACGGVRGVGLPRVGLPRFSLPSARRVAALVVLVLLVVGGVLFTPEAHGQDIVRVRATVAARDGSLALRDIADLSGERAIALGDVAMGEATPGRVIRIDEVRAKIEASGLVSLGLLRVQGATCEVLGAAPASVRAPGARATPAAPPEIRPGTVGAAIPVRLAELLGVREDDLRITFEASDAALLETPVPRGGVLSLTPHGEGERVSFAVRLYAGDRLAASGSVRAGVGVRRTVLVARRALARGGVLGAEDVAEEARFVPMDAAPATRGAIGMEVRSRVGAGEVVLERDVAAPVVVKRGDLIGVDCVSGGFIVRTTARAMEAGREGDVISLQALNSKHSFRARVAKPGLAVVVVGETK